jgi:hypothetical protein
MPVEPLTMYRAYCDDDECEWQGDPGEDSGDAEIALSVHMAREHGAARPLPFGYEYRQADLEAALSGA